MVDDPPILEGRQPKIADAIEKRSFLRTLLDEQIEKSDGDKKEKLVSELGTFGQKDDNEEAIELLLEDTVPDFVEKIYEKICADDTRLHNTFWLLVDDPPILEGRQPYF